MKINEQTLNWLLEESNPSVRYLVLRNLVKYSEKQLEIARLAAYEKGPIPAILKHMNPEGFWVKPGPGYNCKYKSGVWSLIALSQLGAHIDHDDRIKKACMYCLENDLSKKGAFGIQGTTSTSIDCLQGNLCAALTILGVEDKKLDFAYDWLARSITGEGIERYYAYNTGSNFSCGFNNKQSCAWGAIKAMLALSKIPENKRTDQMKKAIKIGVEFLLSTDPAKAEYPTKDEGKQSRNWWKLSFPVFYITDILQNIEVLIELGYGKDKKLKNSIELILQKRGEKGRWSLEYPYKTWFDFGSKNKPNKWVTYRVLKILNDL